jgi:raffinose/stachyose/melibiose transport system substrate-binding protein
VSESRLWVGRLARAAVGVVAVVSMTVGCSTGGPATVSFHLSKPEAIPYFRALVEDYNASQDEVRVVLDTSSNLQAGFLRGNPPDLGLLNYNMEIARFVERGTLTDLSDTGAAQRIRPDLQELVDQYATYPDRTSVLPYSVMAASVIYNQEIFAEHDLEVPQTWDELIEVCEALQDAGVTPFYATFSEPWTIGQGWFDYTVGGSLDTAEFFDELNELGTDVGPDSPVSFENTMVPPTEQMLVLTENYVNENAAGQGYGDGNSAFAQGQAAMYLQGPWALGEIALTDPDLELGTFPLPMTDDPDDLRVRVNLDLAAWIPEASPNQEAARDFLEYLFQQEVMDEYNESQLGFGTTVDAAPVTDPRIVGMKEYYDEGEVYQGASVQIPLTIPFFNYLQGIVYGADPQAQMRVVDADWARLAMRR